MGKKTNETTHKITSKQWAEWFGGESGGGLIPLGKPENEYLVFQLDPYRIGREGKSEDRGQKGDGRKGGNRDWKKRGRE